MPPRPTDPRDPRTGEANWRYPPDEPSAAGHFPGNPIIPGAVLLRDILAALPPEMVGVENRALTINAAKFHQPVRPGDAVLLTWTRSADEIRFTCCVAGSDRPAVSGALRFAPP